MVPFVEGLSCARHWATVFEVIMSLNLSQPVQRGLLFPPHGWEK